MKNVAKAFCLSIFLCTIFPVSAQKYYDLLKQPKPNLEEVRNAYEEYYKTHEFVKNEHTRVYKNWMKLYKHSLTLKEIRYCHKIIQKVLPVSNIKRWQMQEQPLQINHGKV